MVQDKVLKVKKQSKELECPICHTAMKTNHDFQVAKCEECGYELCWKDPVALTWSVLRLAEEIGVRKHRWRRNCLPSHILLQLPF